MDSSASTFDNVVESLSRMTHFLITASSSARAKMTTKEIVVRGSVQRKLAGGRRREYYHWPFGRRSRSKTMLVLSSLSVRQEWVPRTMMTGYVPRMLLFGRLMCSSSSCCRASAIGFVWVRPGHFVEWKMQCEKSTRKRNGMGWEWSWKWSKDEGGCRSFIDAGCGSTCSIISGIAVWFLRQVHCHCESTGLVAAPVLLSWLGLSICL